MKRWFTVVGLLYLTVSLVGCSTGIIAANQATVKLEGNPTTGYVWGYRIANPDIVRDVADDYIGAQLDDDVVGVGGTYTFTFKGVAEGETEIVFDYHRPWEEDIAPEKTVRYIAVVDSDLVLTLIEQ